LPAGRRAGTSTTREAILETAREGFARDGFDGTSVRSVARSAGVDPALVHHFFKSKEDLFLAAVAMPVNPEALLAPLMAGGRDQLGEGLVRMFLKLWEDDDLRLQLVAMLRSSLSSEAAGALLREFVTHQLAGRLALALDLPHARLRATLAGSQLAGLAMVRYVVGVEPLASASVDTLVSALGPTLQRYLTGSIDSL
jgi:AcrR family transcriptional regulator